MKLTRFRQLGLDKQLGAVMERGVLLLACRRYNIVIRLFNLDGFYVEVLSNPETKEVLTIVAYVDEGNLDHLLDEIDITAVTEILGHP